MAPARTPQQICRVGVAAVPRAGLSQRSVGFRNGDAKLAIPIQALAMRLLLPLETPDAGEMKNVYSQGHFPKRISLLPSRGPHSAKRETAGDLPFLLLFRAIAKAREVPQRRVHGVRQIREYARVRVGSGFAPRPLARWHVGMIAAANPGAHNDPILLPIFRQAAANNAHH